ncbi:MAG: hypothetical protein KAH05_02585, partial [Clostridiales bacterium]|nr:hypothetical protein [Clostridiales bacterium]
MNLFAIFAILLFTFNLSADYSITRGPEIGEIYYRSNTLTGKGIYRSTDFGETATCMDSTNYDISQITADLTPGVVYGKDLQNNLYISYNYGQEGSWTQRNTNVSIMHSSRNEGHIYHGISRHSENYGVTFFEHLYNGYFGSFNSSEIDNEDNIGYAIIYDSDIMDSLFLLISYDDFENLEIQHSFNRFNGYIGYNPMTSGYNNGEVYMIRSAVVRDGSLMSEL